MAWKGTIEPLERFYLTPKDSIEPQDELDTQTNTIFGNHRSDRTGITENDSKYLISY